MWIGEAKGLLCLALPPQTRPWNLQLVPMSLQTDTGRGHLVLDSCSKRYQKEWDMELDSS